jgi:hypothetical protein
VTEDKKQITADLNAIALELYPMVDSSKRIYTPDTLALVVLFRRELAAAVESIRREIYKNRTLTLNKFPKAYAEGAMPQHSARSKSPLDGVE